MRTIQTLLVTAALLFVGANAPAAEGGFSTDAKTAHAEADRNHDGNIDHAEFQRRLVEVFYFADADRDGFLAVSERDTTGVREVELSDDDGNGKITLREFMDEGFDRFEAADTNGDELLSVQEVEAAYAK